MVCSQMVPTELILFTLMWEEESKTPELLNFFNDSIIVLPTDTNFLCHEVVILLWTCRIEKKHKTLKKGGGRK